MKKFIVDTPSNLKDFTDCVFPQGSFAFSALLRGGDIRINGVKTKNNVALAAGDEVVYYTTQKQEEKPSHSVVYEDGNLLIADKYSGVSSEGLLSELGQKGEYFAVHRLDRNTCGLIVFAKTERAERELIDAFRKRNVQKIYLCIARNAFRKEKQTLTAYLKKDEIKAESVISDKPLKGYAEIVTEVEVLKRQGDIALVQVVLHTGKTHQIRAHLAHIGCPVLGDEKYGDRELNKKYAAKRQKLVAKSLQFHLCGELSYLNGTKWESAFFPSAGN